MPRIIRPGLEYFGVDVEKIDLEVLRKYAADEDRSVGSLIRLIVADWISKNPKRNSTACSILGLSIFCCAEHATVYRQ